MAAIVQYNDPTTHPRFMREYRQITAILTRSLISRGWPECEAHREAEAILAPIPVKREPSQRTFPTNRSAGA